MRRHPASLLFIPLSLLAFATTIVVASCHSPGRATAASTSGIAAIGTNAWRDRVMTSAFCGTCHPDIYAEHAMNTHGRAFTDPEVRLATGDFEHGDCIRCHTPRPVFETGIGLNPQRRYHGLEEGNTCMTCHWREGVDYASFAGGEECKTAFDPRVGTVEACASCHRNHGTPYQWELAPNGKGADRTCMTCHMKQVERPVAVGGPVRKVRVHVFPGARDEAHVRRAYEYEAKIVDNEVLVTISNIGAGHNFPTELKQRSLESLVVVRDVEGKEVARSRLVFRDPYKRPYGLHLPVNTQIPSGEHREHRVPINVANGTVDCELHFKHYFPIEDHHPQLSRQLEMRRLLFADVTPSDKKVETDPEVKGKTPEGIDPQLASVADFVDFTRPPIGKTQIDVPQGNSPADIKALVDLFMFPVPQGNREAQKRLLEIGQPAVQALIEALGSWDGKTFNQAMLVLEKMGAPAVPAIRDALRHSQLYVRMHARRLLGRLSSADERLALLPQVLPGLAMPNALDRSTTCELLGRLGARAAIEPLQRQLADGDPDVVMAAAGALVALDARDAVPALEQALARATFDETRIELAYGLARLGSVAGIPELLRHLDHRDDLIRTSCFEKLFAVTGKHFGFESTALHEERLAAIARLQAWWAQAGKAEVLQRPHVPEPRADDEAFHLITAMGGGDVTVPAVEDDAKAIEQLVGMGADAIPALIKGLKFPPGFAAKRASLLTAIGRIADKHMAPFVAQALRDPVLGVAAYAAQALETCGDPACLPALVRFQERVRSLAAAGHLPASIPNPDTVLVIAARSRLLLGDEGARVDLVGLLLSDDAPTRGAAIEALRHKYGDARGYDPVAAPEERRRAVARWRE
ncbi:MAG TPA: HEAT repeat domain-containing protein [Planctomycetota bacterium]